MVSDTVEVVSVWDVMLPCVKLGTTGTDIAVGTFARADTTATIASFFLALVHFLVLMCCQVVKKVIYHLIVNSVTNCPMVVVPDPPPTAVTT